MIFTKCMGLHNDGCSLGLACPFTVPYSLIDTALLLQRAYGNILEQAFVMDFSVG